MHRSQSSDLFGALVHSRVPSVNVQLDIPDLQNSANIVIPTFHKRNPVEVGTLSEYVVFTVYNIFKYICTSESVHTQISPVMRPNSVFL